MREKDHQAPWFEIQGRFSLLLLICHGPFPLKRYHGEVAVLETPVLVVYPRVGEIMEWIFGSLLLPTPDFGHVQEIEQSRYYSYRAAQAPWFSIGVFGDQERP